MPRSVTATGTPSLLSETLAAASSSTETAREGGTTGDATA
jgi:hypothetical protein